MLCVQVDAREWEAAHKARWLAAPAYLKRRVERGEPLPRVTVEQQQPAEEEGKKRGREQAGGGEAAAAVLSHVVSGMKEDPFLILMDMIRYR